MVLFDTIDEKLKATLLFGDNAKYVEERQLLNQMSMFLNMEEIYNNFFRYKKLTYNKDLPITEKNRASHAMWQSIRAMLYDIMPIEEMSANFVSLFENIELKSRPNNRIATLQNDIITYFAESLKAMLAEGIISEEEYDKRIVEFKDKLIGQGSVILDSPELNLGLDESMRYFDTKKAELDNFNKNIVK